MSTKENISNEEANKPEDAEVSETEMTDGCALPDTDDPTRIDAGVNGTEPVDAEERTDDSLSSGKAENDAATVSVEENDANKDDSVKCSKDEKPEKPKKKSWRKRSIPERLVTLIPALLMFAVFVIAEWQMEIGEIYTTEFKLSLLLVAVAVVIGIFCIRLGKVWGWIVTALTPAASFLLLEFFTHNPFKMTRGLVITNLIFFYGTALLVLFLTGSMKASVVVTAGVPMIFGIANYYAIEFRGNPLFPWDIASAGIAADVVDNYKFIISWHVCFIVCAFLFIIMLGFLCTPKIRLKWWWLRAPVSVIAALALVFTGSYVQSDEGVSKLKMYPYLFTPKHVYKVNGVAATFAYTLQFAGVPKPDNYSTDNLTELLEDYESETVDSDDTLPNVIVIMNEAFSDLRTAADYKENIPVTPYIDSMDEDTVKGNLHVSVKGGNTANSEFEFLTGLSMAHFSPGSIPYQQYLKGETPSFASQLSELGYKTVGMHPYGATGWNRDSVYEWFGFDETYFSSDFKGCEKIRNYYTDAATYQKIIELYENKDEDKPLFVFDVTMQNHGGYTSKHDNFTPDLHVSGLATAGVTNTYLSLINESDEAFGELIEYFKTQDEPTVILMFGDHQPNDNVVKPLWNLLGMDVENGTLEEQLLRYTVPFVMWANYDIEEDTEVDTSLNYLSSILCETAGIPRTAAQMYLSELSKTYPVISAGHYSDAEGNYYDAVAMDQVDAINNDYAMMSYNLVADRKNTLREFFSYK